MSPNYPYSSYQPVSMFPDRAIYRAADAYYHAYPYTNAIAAGLTTPGNRMDKYDAATDALTYGLGYRAGNTLAVKGMNKLYEKFPRLAEFANRHPIVSAIPVLAVGILAGEVTGRFSLGTGRFAKRNLGINKVAEKALYSRPGNLAAKWLKPVEKFLMNPKIRMGLGITALAAFGFLAFRMIQDSLHFGHNYKQARQDQPALSPNDLKRQVVQRLMQERSVGHTPYSGFPPEMLKRLQETTPSFPTRQ